MRAMKARSRRAQARDDAPAVSARIPTKLDIMRAADCAGATRARPHGGESRRRRALVVRDGVIVGRAGRRTAGRPHAERIALARPANRRAWRDALRVAGTPQPSWQTPPCAEAIIAGRA